MLKLTGVKRSKGSKRNKFEHLFFFFFLATPVAYANSWARDQVRAAGATFAAGLATPDPYLTVPQWEFP